MSLYTFDYCRVSSKIYIYLHMYTHENFRIVYEVMPVLKLASIFVSIHICLVSLPTEYLIISNSYRVYHYLHFG